METSIGGKNNREAENIDMSHKESDSSSNANNIPKPESPSKKQQGSKRSKNNNSFPVKTYIYIDDDDESPISDSTKHSPVKISKGKRTYPGKDPNSCNGPTKQSDGNPSADNVSKCEFKVDSKGVLQKLWEKASLKKKPSVESESGSIQVFQENVENEAQLQIQVVNLLKRKEAEKLRLLDVERRQKQRVKEIRETQRKVEENMKLKEIYRTKVQHDLKNLEMTCHDMSSLLRALGILVDNNPYVSSNQIHAAYKRALLRFHPDRASGTDMYQQVEDEEKFKLISRMRAKLLS